MDDDDAARVVSLAFAEQVLPNPVAVKTPAIPKWGGILARRVEAALTDHAGPFRLHVIHADGDDDAERTLTRSVDTAIQEALPKALARRRVLQHAACPTDDELFIQVLLTSPRTGLFSVCTPAQRTTLRRCLSRFPAGQIAVPEDERPPSRAFMKVLQAELHLGRSMKAGETAVDLGACPGGWSYVAVQRGMTVVAVDRTPLREDLMANAALTFIRGDAFKWRPPAPVDWLLCDVIAFPERTLEMLKDWLGARLCRRLVVTVKFKGEADYPTLEHVKKLLKSNTREWCIRHLPTNRNEVTVIAECAAPEGCWGPKAHQGG